MLGPDVKDRQTLLTLAKMTSNAYVTPDSGQWWPTAGYNVTLPFGWEPDTDGLRRLVPVAERLCYVTNTLRRSPEVTVDVGLS